MFGWILLLSIVGFLIWSSTRKRSGNSTSSKEEYLRKSLSEFENVLKDSPNKTVKGLLEDYRAELRIESGVISETKTDGIEVHEVTNKPTASISWSHWYSKNSINLLLYVGAFLIVASASIFVGFAWESLSGIIKSLVLTSVAVAFFGFGTWFFNIPKIRDAGNTFIAIGAVLIPVCGYAWFNLVFKEMGVSPGIVWLMTSVAALGVYLYLAFNYKNKFYSYACSITALSLTVSIVNTFSLDPNFYILAGIITSFVLLLLSFWSRNHGREIQDFTLLPLQTSSQVMMPLVLAAGFITAINQDKLFTLEAVLSVFLATGFYVLSYLYFKKAWFMALSEVLFSAGVMLLFYWQNFDKTLMLYILNLCGFAYLYKASILARYNLKEEVDISLAVSVAQSALIIPLALALQVSSLHLAFLSIMPSLSGIGIASVKNDIRYIGISSLSIALSIPLFMADVFKISDYTDYLGYVYLVVGLIFYSACVYFKDKTGAKKTFGLSAILFFVLSFIPGFDSDLARLIISLVLAGVAIHSAWIFNLSKVIYVSNFLILFAVFNFLGLTNIVSHLHPFYYAGVAYILYCASWISFMKNFQEAYKVSALVLALTIMVIGGVTGLSSGFLGYTTLERNLLITAYLTTILYGIDLLLRKTPNFGYITSALGMATFLWQIKYLGVSESLAYTIPLGLYFMALAFTRSIKGDGSGRNLLDYIGLVILLAPPAYSSFADEGVKYIITLGIAGVGLILGGISLRYKLYKVAGVVGIVLAVLPQTYTYILDLPRWVIVGIGGILFISVAIFLSLKRKDSN